MINVLIVDDDKLVRKGLMYTVPWEKFGMEVVGEAGNGEKAKEFIENHAVDLLITDLAMPVMSGIELMRFVRMHYSHIWIVVLTFHQDFEYVQEALRLGAVDYIAKVQLEQEQIEDLFQSILKRMQQGKPDVLPGQHPDNTAGRTSAAAGDRALVFIQLLPHQDNRFPQDLPLAGLERAVEVENGMWFVPMEEESHDYELETVLHDFPFKSKWRVLSISDMRQIDIRTLFRLLRDYRCQDFFYEFEYEKVVYPISIPGLNRDRPIVFEQDLHRLREQWSSLYWINHDELFQNLLFEMESLRPPIAKLESMMYSAAVNWKRLLSVEALSGFEWSESLHYWEDWTRHIESIRKMIRSRTNKQQYSADITASIVKAVDYMKNNFSAELKLEETAKYVNMSRSYFSQCFKDIIGHSFNDFVKEIRMEHAKSLLRLTDKPVYWIAEQCGYPNEKYFRKVFRDFTGALPTEYRHRKD